MYDNYNYPAGADNPSAPWNEPVIPEQEFEIHITQTLSKNAIVSTDDYIPETDDETGEISVDTTDTNWLEEYEKDHFTPLQLIAFLKRYLEEELSHDGSVSKNPLYIKYLISECDNWVNEETEIEEN